MSVQAEVIINDKASPSLDKVSSGLDRVTDSAVKTTRATDTAARQFEALARAADPAYGILAKLADQHGKVQRAVDLGVKSQSEADKVFGQLHATAQTSIQRLAGMSAGHLELSTQSQAAAHAVRGFIEQIALGSSPLRAMTSEMAHLSYAATGEGGITGAFSQIGTLIRGFITPTTAAIAGFAAMAGGLGLLLARTIETESRLRSLKVAVTTLGTGDTGTAANLEGVARSLRDTGTPVSEANTIAAAIARNPALDPAAAQGIAATGRDIGAVLGVTATQGVDRLTAALSGSVEKMIELGNSLNAFGPGEEQAIREADRLGQHVGALVRAYGDVATAVDGRYRESQSTFQKETEESTAAWNRLLDRLSDSRPFRDAAEAIERLANVQGVLQNLPIIGPAVTLAANYARYRAEHGISPQSAGEPIAASAAIPSSGSYASNFSVAPGVIMSGQANTFADMLSHAAEQLPPGYGLVVTSVGRPGGSRSSVGMGSAHVQGLAADFQIVGPNGERLPNIGADPTGLYARTFQNAQAYSEWAYPDLAGHLRTGASFGANGGPISTSSPADIGHIDLRGNGAASPLSPLGTPDERSRIEQANEALTKENELVAQSISIWQQRGVQQQAAQAAQDAFNKAVDAGATDDQALAAAGIARTRTVTEATIALQKQRDEEALTARGALDTARAYGTDVVSGLRGAAEAQARYEVTTKGIGDVATRTHEILVGQATDAARSTAVALTGLNEQATANTRLAEGAKAGAAALHEAGVQNEIVAATRDVLNKAEAAGIALNESGIRALYDKTAATIRANDAERDTLALRQQNLADRNQIAIVQLETGLVGQPAPDVEKQVAGLKAVQDLQARNVELTSAEAQDRLKTVAALGDANRALGEAQRNQQRLDDGIRSVAGTVDNTLAKAITDAFSGQKVQDWATTVRQTLGSIVAEISSALFIKPLTGQPLGIVGWGNFGTLGETP